MAQDRLTALLDALLQAEVEFVVIGAATTETPVTVRLSRSRSTRVRRASRYTRAMSTPSSVSIRLRRVRDITSA